MIINRKIKRVFIHCSAASRTNIDAEEIDLWHRQRGWSGIGYHFFIKTSGKLEIGRDIEKTPAAQRFHNRHTIAICLNGLKKSDFTENQFIMLRNLCAEIKQGRPNITFHGHCEVSAKACPVFDYKSVLKLDKKGKLGLECGD